MDEGFGIVCGHGHNFIACILRDKGEDKANHVIGDAGVTFGDGLIDACEVDMGATDNRGESKVSG